MKRRNESTVDIPASADPEETPIRDHSRQQVLVSFCNVAEGQERLGVVTLDPLGFRPLHVPDPRKSGFTGVTQDDRHVYAIGQKSLSVLDRETLACEGVYKLPQIVAPHSISVTNGSLTIVSTGTDEVLTYALHGNGSPKKPKTPTLIWSASTNGQRMDSHHLNGLCARPDGRGFLLSGFDWRGRWNEVSERERVSGFVRMIPEGDLLAEGLFHPHSVTVLSDGLAWCESGAGAVHLPGRGVIRRFVSYPRGLCQVGNLLLVGTSG
ncbi:MAG: DUF4915 domain-containing protein, partial [Thermomicrobiales bacterium]